VLLQKTRIDLIPDDSRVHLVNPAVAIHATGKWMRLAEQVQCAQDFQQLLPGFVMP
jgi:hypothetical protein